MFIGLEFTDVWALLPGDRGGESVVAVVCKSCGGNVAASSDCNSSETVPVLAVAKACCGMTVVSAVSTRPFTCCPVVVTVADRSCCGLIVVAGSWSAVIDVNSF